MVVGTGLRDVRRRDSNRADRHRGGHDQGREGSVMGRPRKDPAEIMVARDTGSIDVDGVPHFIRRNVTRVRVDHPVYKAAPHLFKKLEAHYDVEQMTRAPGEKRG